MTDAHTLPDWLPHALDALEAPVQTPDGWKSGDLRLSVLREQDGVHLAYGRWVVIVHRVRHRVWVCIYTAPGTSHGTKGGGSLAFAITLALGRAPQMPEPLVRALAHLAAGGAR